jgi:putative flippase GtrA
MIEKIKELYIKYKEIINYLIVGGLTTFVALGVYYGSVLTFLNPNNGIELQIANILSWIAGVIFAYFTNRKYVFESKNPNKLQEAAKFTASRLVTLFLDMATMFIGVTLLKFNDKIIKLIAQVLVIIGNYIFSKLFVFNKAN